MKFSIIQIGKNKDRFIEEGVTEFVSKLKQFGEVEFSTAREIRISKAFPKEKAILEEGEEISKILHDKKGTNKFVCALDENGKEFSSKDFADVIKSETDKGVSQFVFIIGGPFGLSEEVKKKAKYVISFSKMTFTHQLIRLFLLEQLYRAMCINRGIGYHHE